MVGLHYELARMLYNVHVIKRKEERKRKKQVGERKVLCPDREVFSLSARDRRESIQLHPSFLPSFLYDPK